MGIGAAEVDRALLWQVRAMFTPITPPDVEESEEAFRARIYAHVAEEAAAGTLPQMELDPAIVARFGPPGG